MNSKHRKTLRAVFDEPTPASLEWREIESLLQAVGCTTTEGNGSRVRFAMGQEIETFHRPHPGKEAKRYQVRAARAYLIRLGITS